MIDLNFIILYVNDPLRSTEFYSDILESSPVELEPTFAMFVLENGVKLGLWGSGDVEPPVSLNSAATENGFGGEIAFPQSENKLVDSLFTDWKQRGLSILQEPTQMDFGYTFVALDPDGHRLRVFSPSSS